MIDANKILQTDALDLIFEGRNKAYGAYELRTNYRRRLMMAVISMMVLCGCVILLTAFGGKAHKKPASYLVDDVELKNIQQPDQPEPPRVEPPKPPQQIQTIQFTTPKITNEPVKPDEMPPPVDDVADVKIGTANIEGVKGDDIVAPPISGDNTGVTVEPKKQDEEEDKIHLTVQIESQYPGGLSAWIRYLTKTLPRYYTDDLVERNIQGRVLVQFVVDAEGNVSNVQGVEGPKELIEVAEKVIRQSGKWTPAIQNGRKVKSYKRQPIIFRPEEE